MKTYLNNGDHIEADSVVFTVANGNFINAHMTDASNLKYWHETDKEWYPVHWDFSVTPARLYYER